MSLGHLISARTIGKIDVNFSDSDDEQSDIKQQSERSQSHELENGRLDEQKENFLKQQKNKKPQQPFSFKEYQTLQRKYSLNCNKDNGCFLQTFKDHPQTQSKVDNIHKISNNKKLSQKSPFIKQLKEKEDNNYSNRKKMSSEWTSRGKELTKQKKRIQLLNCSTVMQDLQQIKLNHQLKRWDTAATETDSVGKISQKLLQTMGKNQMETKLEYQKKEKQNLSSEVEEKIHNQIEMHQSSSDRRQQTESDGVSSQNQMNNFQLNLKIPTINFYNMNQLEFDSESQNEIQNQSEQEIQKQQQQQLNLSENQQEKNSLFSQGFRTKEYLQMRANFFDILLGKTSISFSDVKSSSKPSSSDFPQLQSLRYGQNIKKLLTTEIPLNNMFQFQVHVYKDLFKTQYQLWMRQGCSTTPDTEEKILLAAAYNQTFHIDKSIFIIEQVDQNNRRQFIGQLESNFLRDFYVLHGYQTQEQAKLDHSEDSQIRLQTNCASIKEIMNVSLNINRTVYLPNLFNYQNSSRLPINSQKTSNNSTNLKELYQNDRFDNISNRVSKLVNSKTCYFDLGFYSKFGIRKSNKTLLMTDSRKGNHTLFIGKTASKKYKLMIGEGLSPLQALGILITHVENN